MKRLKKYICTFCTFSGRKSTSCTCGAQAVGKILFNRLHCDLYLQRLVNKQVTSTEASLPATTSLHGVLSKTKHIDTVSQELFLACANFPTVSRNYWERKERGVIWHIQKCIDNYCTSSNKSTDSCVQGSSPAVFHLVRYLKL